MKRFPVALSCLALLLVFGAAPSAHALLISVTGAGLIIPAPALIGDPDNPLASAQQGFNEKQGVFLILPLVVDGVPIPAGTVVDSHMIFFNQSGDGPLTKVATWTFSGEILGVMSDIDGTKEAGSSPFLGAPGTLGYPAPGGFSSRGMEPDDSYSLTTATTLEVRMNIAQPGDWIRVITRSSVPDGGSAGILLGLGVLALAGLRRATSGLKG